MDSRRTVPHTIHSNLSFLAEPACPLLHIRAAAPPLLSVVLEDKRINGMNESIATSNIKFSNDYIVDRFEAIGSVAHQKLGTLQGRQTHPRHEIRRSITSPHNMVAAAGLQVRLGQGNHRVEGLGSRPGRVFGSKDREGSCPLEGIHQPRSRKELVAIVQPVPGIQGPGDIQRKLRGGNWHCIGHRHWNGNWNGNRT